MFRSIAALALVRRGGRRGRRRSSEVRGLKAPAGHLLRVDTKETINQYWPPLPGTG